MPVCIITALVSCLLLTLLKISEHLIFTQVKAGNKDFRWSLVYFSNLPFFLGTKGTGSLLLASFLAAMLTVAS